MTTTDERQITTVQEVLDTAEHMADELESKGGTTLTMSEAGGRRLAKGIIAMAVDIAGLSKSDYDLMFDGDANEFRLHKKVSPAFASEEE